MQGLSCSTKNDYEYLLFAKVMFFMLTVHMFILGCRRPRQKQRCRGWWNSGLTVQQSFKPLHCSMGMKNKPQVTFLEASSCSASSFYRNTNSICQVSPPCNEETCPEDAQNEGVEMGDSNWDSMQQLGPKIQALVDRLLHSVKVRRNDNIWHCCYTFGIFSFASFSMSIVTFLSSAYLLGLAVSMSNIFKSLYFICNMRNRKVQQVP